MQALEHVENAMSYMELADATGEALGLSDAEFNRMYRELDRAREALLRLVAVDGTTAG